jgi:hypothetical protein
MNSVSSCCCNLPDRFSTRPANWTYQSAQIEKAVIAGDQNTDIEIQTADGDKVTLSSTLQFESSALVYEELGRAVAYCSDSSGQLISAEASSKFEMTVEGTLDEQEKQEIRAILMNLFKMVRDFITGQTDPENPQSLADLTTISKVKAEFDVRASVTVASTSFADYEAQSPEIRNAVKAYRPEVEQRVDKLTDRMIAAVKDSGVEPSKILNRLNRHLSRLSRRFMHPASARGHKRRLEQEIMADFARKLRNLAAENGALISKEEADAQKPDRLNEPAVAEMTASAGETILNAASQNFHFEVEYSAGE